MPMAGGGTRFSENGFNSYPQVYLYGSANNNFYSNLYVENSTIAGASKEIGVGGGGRIYLSGKLNIISALQLDSSGNATVIFQSGNIERNSSVYLSLINRGSAREVNWRDYTEAMPAFMAMIMMPLLLAPAGEINIIKRVGGKPDIKSHLETMGFVPEKSYPL